MKIFFFSFVKILIILVIILVGWYIIYWLIGFAHPIDYIGWKKISVSGFGSFKIPKNWIVNETENVLLITDKPIEIEDHKIYLIGLKGENKYFITNYELFEKGMKNDIKYYPYNKLFENVEYIGTNRGAIFSVDTSYIVGIYDIRGNIEKRYVLSLHKSGDLFAWDNLIDEKTIRKIMKYREWEKNM
jgi:hypothetical protein